MPIPPDCALSLDSKRPLAATHIVTQGKESEYWPALASFCVKTILNSIPEDTPPFCVASRRLRRGCSLLQAAAHSGGSTQAPTQSGAASV